MKLKYADVYDLNRDGENKCYISNVAGGKIRVSIVRGWGHINYTQGELLYQQVYRRWNKIPCRDAVLINRYINGDMTDNK